MVAFLSPEWLAALDGAASGSDAGAGMEVGEEIVIEQVVSGPEGGASTYHIVLDADGAAVRSGPHPHPTVRFTTDPVTAAAVHLGEQTALGAFRMGQLEVSGDLAALERRRPQLAVLDEAFRAVRSTTEVGDA